MIKWITEQLGTAEKSKVDEKGYHIIDVRDLVDKKGNPERLILGKINEGIKTIGGKGKVVICCDYGISRSNAIAVGILVKHYGYNFNEAVKYITDKTGGEEMLLGFLNSVRTALRLDKVKKKNKKTILITGAQGFIGSTLTSLLKDKYELITPLRSEIDLVKGQIDLDLIVKKLGVNLIVHLANPSIYTTTQSMGETIVMLKNVLDICKENEIPILYPSGLVVFAGYKRKILTASENLPLYPKDTYGETKMLCENLLNQYREFYGLNIALLRLSPVYGPSSDKPKFIWQFFEKAKKNLPISVHKYKNGFQIIDLLNIKDAVSAISSVIEKNFNGTLHIGSGQGYTTFEIAKKIKEILNSKSEISFVEIDDYNANIVMDINKAKKTLGWSPKVSLDEGFGEILKSIK